MGTALRIVQANGKGEEKREEERENMERKSVRIEGKRRIS